MKSCKVRIVSVQAQLQVLLQAATECTDALKLPAVRPYFTASVFLKMSKDLQGTISIPCFHHYIVRKNAMLQTV